MTAKTLYFKNEVDGGALLLQEAAATTGVTTTGWTVGKTPAPNTALMAAGVESASFNVPDSLTPPLLDPASCWRSDQRYAGTFAQGDWQLVFQVRAASAAAGQTGRVNCRVWKSGDASGSPAVELTSGLQVGTTTAAVAQSGPTSSAVTWAPAASVTLDDEYLFVQCEWEVVGATGNANSDVLFFVDATANVTTPDFAAGAVPQFSLVAFIDRWTDAEYNLFKDRMVGIRFMGQGMNMKWDKAMINGWLDTADPTLPAFPAFKAELVKQGILSSARADAVFEGVA